MRIGIVADTHGLLRAEVLDVFSQVDHILHAGDIGSLDLLAELEALAPVTAVYGNTDGFELRERLPPVAQVDLEGLMVTITHGDQFGSPTPEILSQNYPEADVIVYGHTHRSLLELLDGPQTIMNPGAAGPQRFDVRPTVGIMEYEPVIPPRARIVKLAAS